MSNTWFKRKVTFRMGENETEINSVLIKNEHKHSYKMCRQSLCSLKMP